MRALALLLAVLIGISLGLLGSGGSIVTLPVLVYVAGVSPHQAVGMSLLIVGGTSALGSLLHFQRGDLDLTAAVLFALSGIVAAFVGARFTHLVSARTLLLCFGALMVLVGLRMLLGDHSPPAAGQLRPWRCLGAGLAVGLLTGFLGVGGGMLIVPALVLFAGLEMKRAVATALTVIAVNSFAGLLGQLHYTQFNWSLTLAFLAAAALGMVAGLSLAHRIPSLALRRFFSCSIILLGAILLLQNLLR